MLRLVHLPFDTGDRTFKKFNPYNQSLKDAYEASLEVAKPDGNIKWLTLLGQTDTGKSHLAIAICRYCIKLGQSARYVLVPELLDELRQGYKQELRATSEGESISGLPYEKLIEFYKNVYLLVLDDLGTQKPTEWAMEKLMIIINHRYENGLRLVVTTNKAIDDLAGDNERRIASRLMRFEPSKVVNIDAPEYRTQRGK